jgi:hypothetical protein
MAEAEISVMLAWSAAEPRLTTQPAPGAPPLPSLRSIVYVSSAVQPFGTAELEALLVDARDLNLQNGITGVLLYSDGGFMQCFEGTDDAMAGTYRRILDSKRHTQITELLNEPVAQRSFSAWQMGLAHATTSDLLRLSTASWRLVDASQADPAGAAPGLALLKIFWSLARQ